MNIKKFDKDGSEITPNRSKKISSGQRIETTTGLRSNIVRLGPGSTSLTLTFSPTNRAGFTWPSHSWNTIPCPV